QLLDQQHAAPRDSPLVDGPDEPPQLTLEVLAVIGAPAVVGQRERGVDLPAFLCAYLGVPVALPAVSVALSLLAARVAEIGVSEGDLFFRGVDLFFRGLLHRGVSVAGGHPPGQPQTGNGIVPRFGLAVYVRFLSWTPGVAVRLRVAPPLPA